MKKKEYIQPKSEIIIMNGDTLMDGEWWSVQVNPEEEIEDDDIGAKQGFFFNKEENWGKTNFNLWED